MGLKLKWFRARMSFKGGSPPEKYNTVTGIGFKQSNTELLPTYKQISTEFSSPVISTPTPHGQFQKSAKREPNPEIAQKIRTILSRSLSNVNDHESLRPVISSKSTEDITLRENSSQNANNSINYRQSDTLVDYEKRKAELLKDEAETIVKPKPRSILKKTAVDQEIVEKIESKTEPVNNGVAENHHLVPPPRKPSSISMLSSVSSEPPPVDYSTLPRNRESISKEWEKLVKPEDTEDKSEDVEDADPYYASVTEDRAYVIEIQEPNNNNKRVINQNDSTDSENIMPKEKIGNGTSNNEISSPNKNLLSVKNEATEETTYAEIDTNKKKKVISFEENITEISNGTEDEIYNENLNQKRLSSISTSSAQSEEYDSDNFYGNDYTNSKRTSYFHAGGATFSSQAASIFITNKKPPTSVNERRPTAFIPKRNSVDSDTSA